jgi:formylglycine-generating enzyme required for sulfatase activity
MKKHTQIEESVEVEEVRLKPLFGMEPGRYLTILYAILLFLILFALLVLPGLVRGGSVVQFRSNPTAAAVYVDNEYIGSTPVDRFIDAGTHRIRVEKAHFSSLEESVEVPRRLFGSLFFPRHMREGAELSLAGAGEYTNEVFGRLSNWALVGSFHERYRYPATVEPAARVLSGEDETALLGHFLRAASNNLGSADIFGDYEAALEAVGTNRAELALDDELYRLYDYLLSSPTADSAEARLLPAELEELLERRVEKLDFPEFYSVIPAPRRNQAELISVLDHDFVQVPGALEAPLGNDTLFPPESPLSVEDLSEMPHGEAVETFYMDSSEVSSRQYAGFLEENPEWRPENRDVLVDKGLVNGEYLTAFDGESERPVTYISWFAAKAYADWIERKLSSREEARYRVRLATEAEWEYAARMNAAENHVAADGDFVLPQAAAFSRTGRLGVADLRGNVWEWTEGWFFPSDLLDGGYGLQQSGKDFVALRGKEKSVRGGAWVNDLDSIPVWERGSQPPSWCTAFTGFRIVLEVVD